VTDKETVKEAAEGAAIAAVQATGPQTRAIVRIVSISLMILVGFIAAIFVLRALTGVLLLLVLAIFFAYLVSPLIEFLRRPIYLGGKRRVMPRPLAIGIIYLILFGALGIGISFLYPSLKNQVEEFAHNAPQYFQNAKQGNTVQRLKRAYDQLPAKPREEIDGKLSQLTADTGPYILGLMTNLLTYVPWLILIPILAFFLLKDADSFRRSALQMLPSGRWRWRGDEFFQDVNSTLAAYIRAQLIACLLIGFICTIGFALLGLRYALLIGILAGFLEFIPLVGPLVVAVVAVLIAGFYSAKLAGGVLLFLAVLRIVHDYVTYPRIIGQGIHLHPLAVILAILSGAELAGIAGIFLAIPVVAITTVTYRHWLEHRGSTGLVADLLKPESAANIRAEATAASEAVTTFEQEEEEEQPDLSQRSHPTLSTTPEEMARVRPDLTSGELKMPKLD
jgi:predicted PurR-regulated permease PerM